MHTKRCTPLAAPRAVSRLRAVSRPRAVSRRANAKVTLLCVHSLRAHDDDDDDEEEWNFWLAEEAR